MKGSNLKKNVMIFAMITFILGLLAVALVDAPLSEASKKLLAKGSHWQGRSEAYLYLRGLNAPLGVGPIEEGKAILANIRILEKKYDVEDFPTLPPRKTLILPEFDFCSFTQARCLESVFEKNKNRLEDKSVVALKERYQRFLKLDDFVDLGKPGLFSPTTDYQKLILANELVLLDAIHLADSGYPEKAVDDLFIVMKGLKRFATKTEDIVGKVTVFTALDSIVDLLFMLFRKYKVNTKGQNISPLSKTELSFEKPFLREFLGVASMYKRLSQNTSWGPERVKFRILFKENLTLNQAAFRFSNAIQLSEVDQVDFITMSEKHEGLKEKKSWIPNPVGTILDKISHPSLDPFMTRGFDLNAKIALFNGLLGKEITPQNVSRISNPYSPSTHGKITADGVCFLMKGEDRSTLCLSAENF